MATLKELRQTRLDKLEQLKKYGIDAYPAKAHKEIDNIEILNKFEIHEGKEYTLAGRITSIRKHGALCFIDLKDQTGEIQLYIKEEGLEIREGVEKTLPFSELNLLDVGDFVEAFGKVVKTQTGQISLEVKYVRILVKSLRPLPNDWDGFKDKETRYRRRYVDMAVNDEVRERMKRRALFWTAHREFLNERGFYEVNIPVLEHIPGGGDAVPFTTHMNAINEDFFLRISHELPLKRLIGGGFEKVYDIGARFRNEGLSDEHLPEHVAMEFYWAYADWKDGMQLIQELFTYVINRVYGDKKIFKIRGFEIDFSKEWEVMDFNEVMKEKFGIKNVYDITLEEVKELLKKNNIEFDRSVNIARGVDALWKKVRKNVAGPAFLINHPKYLSPLQKASIENPKMVERFQPIIAGTELGNGWTEVNDAIDQYERFVEQQQLRDSGDAEAQWLDIDYVEMLEYGMAPTFGWGHSERVFWFLEDVSAKEGVPFPPLKMEISNETKQLYPEVYGKEAEEVKELKVAKGVSSNMKEDSTGLPTREEAHRILEEHVKDAYQILHSNMVASAMEFYANRFGKDSELWYITGLLHDLDYHEFPDSHPAQSLKWFKEWGYPQTLIEAVEDHLLEVPYKEPRSQVGQALIASDELSGLIYAYSVMKPDGIQSVEAPSILKKFKDKGFAAKVNRDEVQFGVDQLGIDLAEHIENLLSVFKKMDVRKV